VSGEARLAAAGGSRSGAAVEGELVPDGKRAERWEEQANTGARGREGMLARSNARFGTGITAVLLGESP
jgi:hypothetical protein